MRAVALTLAAALTLGFSTGPALAQTGDETTPTELWDKYPLDPGEAADQSAPAPGARAAPRQSAASTGSGGPSPVPFIVLPPLLAAAVVLIGAARRRRHPGLPNRIWPRPARGMGPRLRPQSSQTRPHVLGVSLPGLPVEAPAELAERPAVPTELPATAAEAPAEPVPVQPEPTPLPRTPPRPDGTPTRPAPRRRFARARARALGYVSIPAVDDAHREDLRRQVKRIRRACEALELALVDIVPDTESRGPATKRRGLSRIMRRLDRGDAVCLVTTDVQRLATSAEEWMLLLDRLDERDIRLVVTDDALDTGMRGGRDDAWGLIGLDAPLAPDHR